MALEEEVEELIEQAGQKFISSDSQLDKAYWFHEKQMLCDKLKSIRAAKTDVTVQPKTPVRRVFCVAQRVIKSTNFYIPPGADLDIMVGNVTRGEYTVLYGPSQAGKTTLSFDLAEACSSRGYPVVYMALNTSLLRCKSPDEFWDHMSFDMWLFGKGYFMVPDMYPGRGVQRFLAMLSLAPGSQKFHLLIDEASLLAQLPLDLRVEFASAIRNVKQAEESFRVRGVTLVGYMDLVPAFVEATSTSGITFSPERKLTVSRFRVAEIAELLDQFRREWRADIDVQEIASSIFSLTGGFKGLVGTCCNDVMKLAEENRMVCRAAMWSQRSGCTKWLLALIFGTTYRRYKDLIQQYEEGVKQVILDALLYGASSGPQELLTGAMADGILCEAEDRECVVLTSDIVVEIATPLLRSCLLVETRFLHPVVLKDPPANFDIWRVMGEVFCRMNVEVLCRPGGHPSEYAFSVQFAKALELVIRQFPDNCYLVIAQARTLESGRRRLDILMTRNITLPNIAIEIEQKATPAKHEDHKIRLNQYGDVHGAKDRFLINFNMDCSPISFGEVCPGMTEVWVMFDSQGRTVTYGKYPNMAGTTSPLLDGGKLSFQ